MTTINLNNYDELVETIENLVNDYQDVKLPFPYTIDYCDNGADKELLIQFDDNCFKINLSQDNEENFQFKCGEWIDKDPDGAYRNYSNTWNRDYYETVEILEDLRDSIDDAINHYLNPYNHNRRDFGQDDFDLVCYECGSFLDDQTDENVEFFESLVNHLDPEIFADDLELVKNEESYLTATSQLVCDLNVLSL